METGNEDMFLGGDHAHQLREELQRMDRELSTPCRTPTKRPRADEDSDDSDSNLESDSDVQQGSSEGDVQTDMNTTDKKERGRVSAFISKSCGCTLGPNKQPCSEQLTKEQITQCRNNCLEMTRAELDLVILSAIKCSRPPCGESGSSSKTRTLYPSGYSYLHENLLVSSLHIHAILHIHANTHCAPKHTASMEDTQRAVSFITNMAAVHALPLPGRNRTNRDERYLLLPSDMMKAFVFKKYEAACAQDHAVAFKRRKFETVWNEILPYIVTARPATDLCFVCQQNNRLIAKSANMPDHIKSQRLQQAQEHVDRAHAERMMYNSQCKQSSTSTETDDPPTTMHYSYDYAQQVHFPYSPQQTGPEYFITSRKCGIFGVACEPRSFQVKYLIDEAQDAGKGADATISLLHHFLSTHGLKESEVQIIVWGKTKTMLTYTICCGVY